MKKVLLFAALLVAGLTQSQEDQKQKLTIEKGRWTLGGNFSLGISDSDSRDESQINENESTTISVFPNLGYAVGKNLIAGLSFGYGYAKFESLSASQSDIDNFSSNDRRTWTIAPYIRGFLPIGQRAALYAQGEIGYSRTTTEFNDENTNLSINEGTTKSYFIGIRPGFTYFVSKNFALETGLGFLGYTSTDAQFESSTFDRTGESSSFEFSLNSSDLFFGLAYYF